MHVKIRRKKEKARFLMWVVIVASALVFSQILFSRYIGHSSVSSQSGTITELEVVDKFPTVSWSGVYGVAVRLSGFTELLNLNVTPAAVTRKDLFFDCIKDGTDREVYISLRNDLSFNDTITAGVASMLDDHMGKNYNATDSANNSFIDRINISIGFTEITDVPATYTYKFSGDNSVFAMGVLNFSGDLVIVALIKDIQEGFAPSTSINFQALLPMRLNKSTEVFYFYTDPNDECPAGQLGTAVNASLYGFVTDVIDGSYLNGTKVTVAGSSEFSNLSGFYNVTFQVFPGTYNIIGQKDGYQIYVNETTITFNQSSIRHDIRMNRTALGVNLTVAVQVSGTVTDTSDNELENVSVSLVTSTSTTNSLGVYNLSVVALPGEHYIIAVKTGYDNFVGRIHLNESAPNITYDITMRKATIGDFTTGPFTQESVREEKKVTVETILEITKKLELDYTLLTKEIRKKVRQNTFIDDYISIYNFRETPLTVVFSVPPELQKIMDLEKNTLTIEPDTEGKLSYRVYGLADIGSYNGTIQLSGDINDKILTNIQIVSNKLPIELLLLDLEVLDDIITTSEPLRYRIGMQNLLVGQGYKVELRHTLSDLNDTEIFITDRDDIEILTSYNLIKNLRLSENISDGDYVLRVDAAYLNLSSTVSRRVRIVRPFYLLAIAGIPLWIYMLVLGGLVTLLFAGYMYKEVRDRKKRYRLAVDFDQLPQPGPRSLFIGKIAETNVKAYMDMDRLTTHCIIAGATGRGKSISAQVIIEEALLKGTAVIVVDPTAQWSGMLRKCIDKKMLSHYPKFDLKPKDATAFNGNVKQVLNARQIIDLKKLAKPGEITILAVNRIDPKDIDLFVANLIREIFHSNPQEAPQLKMMLVFDEVHRLLPRFGGSGEGFIQVERACREFRKWGMGVMLISQVLSDFVGEIKANINTEVQTRTVDEGDLNRISTKYGDEVLKSLVKADIGVAMVQNAEYNKGKPYFVAFRPILHNTQRLTDDVLEQYNKYNDIIDDVGDQIEQLEKDGVDVFDLKLELKLALDKVKSGNFNIASIYLDGLKPRLEANWAKLGKKPKPREVRLVDEGAIKAELEKAKAERMKGEKKAGPEKKAVEEKTGIPKKPKEKPGAEKTKKAK
ncbi:DUF87 domain-containing protein, partial [Candidatus Woesearchaeota archaeon]|nr:DUF87 domain-containing protein [Candidatus Woesearchaeota archaeon]